MKMLMKYNAALDELKRLLPRTIKQQFIERAFLPNFLFGEKDLVITLGPDGLVINTAKYLNDQPIVAVNPDKLRIDGIMMPFDIASLKQGINKVFQGNFSVKPISMAHIQLNSGQELYAVNDIFIGPRKQLSFRYELEYLGQHEEQCSSGIVISTGAGSTGWLKSIISGSRMIVANFDGIKITDPKKYQFEWDADYLYYCVREPFPSKVSRISLTFGCITKNSQLYLTSQTPSGAVIFSDGIEHDFIEFNSGSSACITVADKKAKLINTFRSGR